MANVKCNSFIIEDICLDPYYIRIQGERAGIFKKTEYKSGVISHCSGIEHALSTIVNLKLTARCCEIQVLSIERYIQELKEIYSQVNLSQSCSITKK
jgi:hypothetical protein